ncbi:MAG: CBS and ACT domain-containing protein [Deltaproteobacteria bacterium]|nr:CBS and ACT domain-containing protein [Deltaproteobacteria bacterium]
MLVREWMTTKVITVTPDISMMKASRLMKEHNIHRLPVLDERGSMQGIISDRDIKEASPSKATTLDIHELYYLLSEIKVRDIMTKNPLSVHGDDSVEQAAILMVDKHIGGLPVVDDRGRLIGIITDSDIFKVFINITGATYGGLQLAFELSTQPGSLLAVLDDLKERDIRVISVLTSQKDEHTRMVYIRVSDLGDKKNLIAHMQKHFNLLYWYPRI